MMASFAGGWRGGEDNRPCHADSKETIMYFPQPTLPSSDDYCNNVAHPRRQAGHKSCDKLVYYSAHKFTILYIINVCRSTKSTQSTVIPVRTKSVLRYSNARTSTASSSIRCESTGIIHPHR